MFVLRNLIKHLLTDNTKPICDKIILELWNFTITYEAFVNVLIKIFT